MGFGGPRGATVGVDFLLHDARANATNSKKGTASLLINLSVGDLSVQGFVVGIETLSFLPLGNGAIYIP